MQSLEVSGAVRPIYESLGVKRLRTHPLFKCYKKKTLFRIRLNMSLSTLHAQCLCACTEHLQ